MTHEEINAKIKTLPYHVQRFIGEQHDQIGRNNQCEHRPTYQAQLDRESEELIALWETYTEVADKNINADDKRRATNYCKILTDDPYGYNVDSLYVARSFGRRMLAPKWALHVEAMRRMQEAIK